uniref:Malate dehydrogenase n=1 Tax=Alexandrium catenella TaxID=2925 RepID=A0A7S1M100_ALECA
MDLNRPLVRESMHAIEMELQDGNFELLDRATFTTEDAVAFKDADYAILLGAYPSQEGKEKKDSMEMNSIIFRTLGQSLASHAKADCKILVVGHPACTNALLCAHHASGMPKENFFAVTHLDQNRASWQLAQRAGVSVGDVRNVIVWGCLAQAPDVDHAEISGQPVDKVLASPDDARWLQEDFVEAVQKRGQSVVEARQESTALSVARAVVRHVKALHCGAEPGELVSMGVWTDGNEYGISNGLYFSMPVHCLGRGAYQVASGLQLSKKSRRTIKEAEAELLQDRSLLTSILNEHKQVPVVPGRASNGH